MDEPDNVVVHPSDRTSVAIRAIHHYFIANAVSKRKVRKVLHGESLDYLLPRRSGSG
jgi:hypothetical protein